MPKLTRQRLARLVRNFKENGIKMMLENAGNVRDTIVIAGASWVHRIDFNTFAVSKTSFVKRDFRHVESDIVCTARLLGPDGKPLKRYVTIYILIEHQSQPDRLMPLRLVEYVSQINSRQFRDWSKKHRSQAGFKLHPVLPIVLYTGTRSWPSLGTLADITESGDEFVDVMPIIREPLFVNLPTISDDVLSSSGAFGAILHLIRDRNLSRSRFQTVLTDVVAQLESLTTAERFRWLELLSYVHAMIYHERPSPEQSTLREIIEQSVGTDPERTEATNMTQTMAEVLREEGRAEGIEKGIEKGIETGQLQTLRATLLRQLRLRFEDIPDAISGVVGRTKDVDKLQSWLDRFVTCQSIEELQIGD